MEIPEVYKHPPIPDGFYYVKGEWNTGFIIRQKRDAFFESPSEFVWIPVCLLPGNGTLDGKQHNLRFGARPEYRYSGEPSAKVPADLQHQAEFVEKYGGFYISRYPVGMDDDAVVCSVEKIMPYTGSCRVNSVKLARAYDGGTMVTAHLPYAAEEDSMLCWLFETGKMTDKEFRRYRAIRDTKYGNRHPIYYTGVQENERNGLFDVLDNVDEWTQEQYDEAFMAGCGLGCNYKTARCYNRAYPCYKFSGFRIALLFKEF